MLRSCIVYLLLLFSATLLPGLLQAQDVRIVNLKTEYTTTPLGIDIEKPRFSWQMQAEKGGCSQTAWQIIITDERRQIVWNSGKNNSDISLNIKYTGARLQPRTRYNWKLIVWDQLKKKHTAASWFETGLMNSRKGGGLSAWSGARWIGGGDKNMVLYAQYLPVFNLNFTLQLDEASQTTRAGFVYGANDNRLMDPNKNLYKLENKKDSSYILVELDIAVLSNNDAAKLLLYRVGYDHSDKKELPFKTFSIPLSLINDKNKYGKHTVYLSSVLGDTQIYIDGQSKENGIGNINLNPLGKGGDFIAFPVLANIGFSVPKGQAAYFSNVEIRNYRSPGNVLVSIADTPIAAINSDAFVIADPTRNSMPMLRTTFSPSTTPIAKARLYVTARGIYEIYLNGKRIGNDYFNPGLTQYNKTHLYQTYDVTDYLLPGKNAIGAILGEGWWSGGATYMGDFWNFFGDRQSLLAKLVITYANGKEDSMVTDPAIWKYFNDGPILYSSFFQGEVYDASKETLTAGWSTAAYVDNKWQNAVETGLEDHISKDEKNKAVNMPMVDDYSGLVLTGQFGEPVKEIKELAAVSVKEVHPGVFVYDMGQNMAGVPKISLQGMEPGKRITLRFAEVLYPDLPGYKENAGMIMLENIRAAMAQDIYITKGGNEMINPSFTTHGYRYIEITGISAPLPVEAVKGAVLSSVQELTSAYTTSNITVNKLWENITWSMYANFMSIPTDCPQRNERLGWSGDISVFSRTATYLAAVPQFFRRHMRAMRDVQREDGRFSDVAPLGGGFGGVLWGSAGITVAWESYQQFNDKEMLVEHYDAMKAYMTFLVRSIDPVTNVLDDRISKEWWALGDWLSPEYDRSEKTLLWESYFIYDLEIMSRIAGVLNKKEDAAWFMKKGADRKIFFNKTYVDPATGKTAFRGRTIDTQTSYVLPLAFNIFDEKNKPAIVKSFVAGIARENKADDGTVCPPNSLMTGFIGTAWINKALSDNGSEKIAYELLQQTTYPSWLYPVEQGATTIWERLNSYTHSAGFGGNNRMNSFNHYSFGAVGAWMYNYSLGIERDEAFPGFKHFVLRPQPDPTGKMTWAKGHYNSLYGRIESGWEIKGKSCYYHFSVPANTTATLYLKAGSIQNISAGVNPVLSLRGVKLVRSNGGKYVFTLQSGDYDIQVSL
ncbi:alpha-L-rhamnosidase [Niastella vici]|uniref:alpha-L-rhamnosidase n=1 Tax=Niastella vici TaxID=1703345 RepID=A0A1V9FEY3_9BACT|nr:alpha-L-rhamnosidase [Niastella vici]OQP56910.1 alpha-L-rhamnosidase [Niastella vici]